MRAILTLTVVGTLSAFPLVGAMAQQTPKETPKQTPATPPGKQAPASPPANQIDSARTPTDKSLTEYWTPERLRDAQPMPMPVVDPDKK